MNKYFFLLLAIFLLSNNCSFQAHSTDNIDGLWVITPSNIDSLEYTEFVIEQDTITFNFEYAYDVKRKFSLKGDSMITDYGTTLFKLINDTTITVNWDGAVIKFNKIYDYCFCENYDSRYLRFLVNNSDSFSNSRKEIIKNMLWEYFGGEPQVSGDAIKFDEEL